MTVEVLPYNDGEAGGCWFCSAEATPNERGIMIDLNANGRLDDASAAITPNGGKIFQAKHQIAPFGSHAVIIDSAGNRVALQAEKL